jgi:hypothetical protein
MKKPSRRLEHFLNKESNQSIQNMKDFVYPLEISMNLVKVESEEQKNTILNV